MKSILGCILKLLLISFFISSLLHASPEVRPISPMRGVFVPVFDSNGSKFYEVIGSSSEISDDGTLMIANAVLNGFSADAKKQWELESDGAKIVRSQRLICGDGPVFMDGGNFTAIATNWKFLYEGRKFVADKNVKVFFEENAVKFLAP